MFLIDIFWLLLKHNLKGFSYKVFALIHRNHLYRFMKNLSFHQVRWAQKLPLLISFSNQLLPEQSKWSCRDNFLLRLWQKRIVLIKKKSSEFQSIFVFLPIAFVLSLYLQNLRVPPATPIMGYFTSRIKLTKAFTRLELVTCIWH